MVSLDDSTVVCDHFLASIGLFVSSLLVDRRAYVLHIHISCRPCKRIRACLPFSYPNMPVLVETGRLRSVSVY
ncbi:hypothetical protein K449DRAFT_66712 [Hypoxylon sp. EC38]|nr:hypothetical protein K449DRAFT_66712 [Hypoxylon sp. EC38]